MIVMIAHVRTRMASVFTLFAIASLLTSCVPATQTQKTTAAPTYSGVTQQQETTRVALLLPLTGNGANVAQSLLNAAQLALFDMPTAHIELLPMDTNGTAEGARAAAQNAVNNNADVIVGPLFADNVKAVSRFASSQRPVLGFSNDWTAASSSTFVLGFLPHAQTERILSYAARRGAKNFVFIAPQNAYGDLVVKTGQRLISSYSLPQPRIIDASAANATTSLETLLATQDIDAVFMPVAPQQAAQLANIVKTSSKPNTLILGTGLWEENTTATYPSLSNAYYAGLGVATHQQFENNYRRNFGRSPDTVASLAYDAVSLVASLNTKGQRPTVQNLTSSAGFNGVDGFFRLRSDGLVDRTLSVIQIQNGNKVIIE